MNSLIFFDPYFDEKGRLRSKFGLRFGRAVEFTLEGNEMTFLPGMIPSEDEFNDVQWNKEDLIAECCYELLRVFSSLKVNNSVELYAEDTLDDIEQILAEFRWSKICEKEEELDAINEVEFACYIVECAKEKYPEPLNIHSSLIGDIYCDANRTIREVRDEITEKKRKALADFIMRFDF